MPMTEEEALIRAREAVKEWSNMPDTASISGLVDLTFGDLRAALGIPPPVDRDLADLRELEAARCDRLGMDTAAKETRDGDYDYILRDVLPTFRAIIQRRIEEAGK